MSYRRASISRAIKESIVDLDVFTIGGGRFRMLDRWVVLDAPVTALPDDLPADTIPWAALGRNAAYPGNVKFVLADGGLRARAEVPMADLGTDRVVDAVRRAGSGLAMAFGDWRGSSPPTPTLHDECAAGEFDSATSQLLQTRCADGGWTVASRPDGGFVIDLSWGVLSTAVLEPRRDGVRLRVVVVAESELETDDQRRAASLLALRTVALVRLCRAFGDPRTGVGFEVTLSHDPGGAELTHGLAAVSVACELCLAEAKALTDDPALAAEYVKISKFP